MRVESKSEKLNMVQQKTVAVKPQRFSNKHNEGLLNLR